MSLRTNLSTRPFYNERAVQTVVVVIAIAVAAATLFNAWQLIGLTGRERTFAAAASRDEARAHTLRQQAARVRSGIDRDRLAQVSDAAREANGVIHGRTFSWTALFNRLEATLPPDVRIVQVSPKVDTDGRLVLWMVVEARAVNDIELFISKLEETRTFDNMLARSERENEEGLIEAQLEGFYHPDSAPPAAAAPAAAGVDDGAAR